MRIFGNFRQNQANSGASKRILKIMIFGMTIPKYDFPVPKTANSDNLKPRK